MGDREVGGQFRNDDFIPGPTWRILWCNAREKALGFYLKVGFKPSGELFTIQNVGKHMLMSIHID